MNLIGVTVKCVGRDGTCARDADHGGYCPRCWAELPRCRGCGHHVGAHEEGPCAVNHHESTTGPECECLGFVGSED